jgi:Mg2+/citrate symporter
MIAFIFIPLIPAIAAGSVLTVSLAINAYHAVKKKSKTGTYTSNTETHTEREAEPKAKKKANDAEAPEA